MVAWERKEVGAQGEVVHKIGAGGVETNGRIDIIGEKHGWITT